MNTIKVLPSIIQSDSQDSNCDKDGCCGSIVDKNGIEAVACNIELAENSPNSGIWSKIRGSVMFTIACLLSPCCTVLIVPILLTLLSGTAAGVWMSQYLGWIYGSLTFLSVVSFGLAFRWLFRKQQHLVSADLEIIS